MFGIINWKTTLGGLSAILSALGVIFHDISIDDYNSAYAMIPALMAGFGLIKAKDSNVTGGSVPQTNEAQRRSESAPL